MRSMSPPGAAFACVLRPFGLGARPFSQSLWLKEPLRRHSAPWRDRPLARKASAMVRQEAVKDPGRGILETGGR